MHMSERRDWVTPQRELEVLLPIVRRWERAQGTERQAKTLYSHEDMPGWKEGGAGSPQPGALAADQQPKPHPPSTCVL